MNPPQEKYTIESIILNETAQGFQDALNRIQEEAYKKCGHTISLDEICIDNKSFDECHNFRLVVYNFLNLYYEKQIRVYEKEVTKSLDFLKNDGRFKIEQIEK